MTLTTVTQANPKTAEFARLFELFDRVATRRTRALAGDTSDVISADDIANVPAEFVPTLKNLSTILSSRARRDEGHAQHIRATSTPTTIPRANAAATTVTLTETFTDRIKTHCSDVMESADGPEEGRTFPLDQRYPFTFKLMLHKLYDLEEWVEKVRDAVEASRSQFKPLAERLQNAVRDATTDIEERGEKKGSVCPVLGSSVKSKPPTATRHVHSAALSEGGATNGIDRGENRISVRPVLGASAESKLPSATRRRDSAAASSNPEVTRVLKKRCIGRRKSLSVWVYDAAISAVEVAGSRPSIEITLSTRLDTGSLAENRARPRALTDLGNMRPHRHALERQFKITVPLVQEDVANTVPLRPSVMERIVAVENGVKRKRSIASILVSEICTKDAVKRPLHV